MREVVISGAARTPMGGFQGVFRDVPAPALGGAAIAAALASTNLESTAVDEVIMGCVLTAGLGQAPARQAGFKAGLDETVPATTLNKMCGSGLRAVAVGTDQIAIGQAATVVAGGMESMSRAPYLLPKLRDGARIGHAQAVDHMFLDGLEDAYDTGRLMGTFAEDCAEAFQFTRRDQDAYAIESLKRALEAQRANLFSGEISPFSVETPRGASPVLEDEQPSKARPERIPELRPAFREHGTVTAANSSSISDGAAAVLLTSRNNAEKLAIPVRARIAGHVTVAQAPAQFPTAPIPAAQSLLDCVGWQVRDVDLWEVNEAFAVVPMAFIREMRLSHDIVNVFGGACALGHPIGASGARIIVTLLNALERHDLKRGVAAICIGGGEGMAIAIERQ